MAGSVKSTQVKCHLIVRLSEPKRHAWGERWGQSLFQIQLKNAHSLRSRIVCFLCALAGPLAAAHTVRVPASLNCGGICPYYCALCSDALGGAGILIPLQHEEIRRPAMEG